METKRKVLERHLKSSMNKHNTYGDVHSVAACNSAAFFVSDPPASKREGSIYEVVSEWRGALFVPRTGQ